MLCFICTCINIFQVCKGRVFHFHKSMILFIHRQVLVFRFIILFMGCIRQHADRAATYLRTALKLCFTSKNTCGTLHPPTHTVLVLQGGTVQKLFNSVLLPSVLPFFPTFSLITPFHLSFYFSPDLFLLSFPLLLLIVFFLLHFALS